MFMGMALTALIGCTGKKEFAMGTYGYDAQFLKSHQIDYVELASADGEQKVMVVPAYQGRVMTTSAGGDAGTSFGWINYRFIESGERSGQFNPVGGEERFWLGPEGGPYSLYFAGGAEQVYANWVVPPVIDTESWAITSQDANHVAFEKQASMVNAAGTKIDMAIRRTVSLLPAQEISAVFGFTPSPDMKVVAYRTDNEVTNTGTAAWTKEGGAVSIWMLSMFNPTPATTVFIPFKAGAQGVVVNDEYFGKVPADRLVVDSAGMLFFKIDGLHRSKIGIPAPRANNICGSYDKEKGILTLLQCTLPEEPALYVNGQWGPQTDSYNGDVINSYNDGPVEDGSIMGPFYEIETSSPALFLEPSGKAQHIQYVIHLQGEKATTAKIVSDLFGVELEKIEGVF